jgi:hypothetical protein
MPPDVNFDHPGFCPHGCGESRNPYLRWQHPENGNSIVPLPPSPDDRMIMSSLMLDPNHVCGILFLTFTYFWFRWTWENGKSCGKSAMELDILEPKLFSLAAHLPWRFLFDNTKFSHKCDTKMRIFDLAGVLIFLHKCFIWPVPMAAWSEAHTVFKRSNTGIVGSKHSRGRDMCPRFSVLCSPV